MDVHLKHESYLGLLGVATLAFGSYAVSRSSRKAFAPGINWSDLLLMGIATHKITRTAARDRVTAPIRAPFTKPFAELDKETNPTPMNVAGGPGEEGEQMVPDLPKEALEAASEEQVKQSPHPLAKTFQHSLGELITCQYCMAPWVALGLHVSYVHRPASARALSSVFAAVALSDVFNRWYGRLEKS